MNIVMFTNTYLPMLGGVAKSVDRFVQEYRKIGHDVLVVAPTFEGAKNNEPGVVRVPAIQNFNGSDFSVALPVPLLLKNALDEFEPDIIHSHHPFLLGDVALRQAASRQLPLVFTHHTMYEHYTHYVPGDADVLQALAREMCAVYAGRCDHVIAPSSSVKEVLHDHDVETPITVIPTGVDTEQFASGDGAAFRREHGIPEDAFVVGHLGRLAPEKNLRFLTEAAIDFLQCREQAHLLVVGDGPEREAIADMTADAGVADRTHLTGALDGQKVVDAYHAMDVFAFASKSETQGMVLIEAMAAGTPVVALEAFGVCDVLRDRENGVLVRKEYATTFVEGLEWVASQKKKTRA
ncbi:MAG: glycosyltransferase, partial [Candidatus Hydrogenedentes bacterium]|nr:glycosyltransferase [Candidatus Hydrogenedentota bacterium]